MIFFRNVDPHNGRFDKKMVVVPRKKNWFEAVICLIWKFIVNVNDPDSCIIPTF